MATFYLTFIFCHLLQKVFIRIFPIIGFSDNVIIWGHFFFNKKVDDKDTKYYLKFTYKTLPL